MIEIMKKISQSTSFRGYTIFPHYMSLLFKEKKLNSASLGWFMLLLVFASFDLRNPQFYGCINKSYTEIGNALNVDASTVQRQVNTLLKVGLLVLRPLNGDNRLLFVNHFWTYDYRIANKLSKIKFKNVKELETLIKSLEPVNMPDDLAITQKKIAELPNHLASLHSSSSSNHKQIFSSSNNKEFDSGLGMATVKGNGLKKNIGNVESDKETDNVHTVSKKDKSNSNCPACNPGRRVNGKLCMNCKKEMDEAVNEAQLTETV